MFNDLKASRFSTRKYRKPVLTRELHERWQKETGYTHDYKTFKELWDLIAAEYIEAVIEEADGVRLPLGIGDIYMAYVPRAQKKFVDFKASREEGKTVYHQNWQTNRKPGKIIYGVRNRKYSYRYATWWGFKACRIFSRAVSEAFKNHPERYKNSLEKRIA